MTTPNWDLINQTLENIRQNPEKFNMGDWAVKNNETCRTTMCFAGWAVVTAGDTIMWEKENFAGAELEFAFYARSKDGVVKPVEYRARDLLGLTGEQADNLFYCSAETVDELERKINEELS